MAAYRSRTCDGWTGTRSARSALTPLDRLRLLQAHAEIEQQRRVTEVENLLEEILQAKVGECHMRSEYCLNAACPMCKGRCSAAMRMRLGACRHAARHCIPRDSFAARVRQAQEIELLQARLKEAEDARKVAEDARKAAEDERKAAEDALFYQTRSSC